MSQKLAGEPPGRITPRDELVNVFEVEAMAERRLPSAVFASIAGSDRRAFDHITFRPRMLVDVRNLDLSTELFGQKMFAPILVGPVSDQRRFHPEGELATAQGASAAQAWMVASSRASHPVETIASHTRTGLWYQVYPERDLEALRANVQRALSARCHAVCLTVGTPEASAPINWRVVEQLARTIRAPLVLKGIMTPEEARMSLEHGVSGIVVSNHGSMFTPGLAAPLDMLPAIVDQVAGKLTVLIDGSFRRGTDILKALALGARAVLIGRPVMWGLAAYGAEGVQTVLEMLQSELARSMALCGKPELQSLDRTLLKIHRR